MEETPPALRVVVISPVRIYVQGLAHLLDAEPGIHLTGTAGGVDTAVPLLVRSDVDVILLDMTGDMASERGLTALHRLTGITTVPCVVLGIPDQPAEVVACAEAGIAGYVTNEHGFADLVSTLRSATRGEFTCRANIAAGLVDRLAVLARDHRPAAFVNLTSRELEIVALIESGYSNKEIARLLHIQLTTAKNHVHNILEKLGVRGRGQVATAVRSQQWGTETARPSLRVLAESG
jgi:two-component system nitrate/nitrite response regulator NarL